MRLIHFDDDDNFVPDEALQSNGWIKSHPELAITPSFFWKPNGVWVSDEDATNPWSVFCRRTNHHLGKYKYFIELENDANVLFISTVEELLKFDEDFNGGTGEVTIPWKNVAEVFSGIIITPYLFECKVYPRWYEPWDCASGCIWDPQAIEKSIRLD